MYQMMQRRQRYDLVLPSEEEWEQEVESEELHVFLDQYDLQKQYVACGRFVLTITPTPTSILFQPKMCLLLRRTRERALRIPLSRRSFQVYQH